LGPKERREREREEVRTRILDAARELFAQEGVDSVTMRRIADRIEYSPTAIYFHFRDKEALLSELCACDFRVFAQRFAGAAAIVDPLERLRAAGHAYIDFGLSHPSHYRLMFMTPKTTESAGDIEKGNPAEDAYAFLTGIIADAIEQKKLRAGLTDVNLVSQVVWAGVHGVISLEIAKCKDEWVDWAPLAERSKLMIDALIDGLAGKD
jgi:AcrR family transcriptional regulator